LTVLFDDGGCKPCRCPLSPSRTCSPRNGPEEHGRGGRNVESRSGLACSTRHGVVDRSAVPRWTVSPLRAEMSPRRLSLRRPTTPSM
jgi:hypothetical protein